VGVLLSILQEEGLVDLNHPVRWYIPEFTGDANYSVRIWHLLTHTSGIIDDDFRKNFGEYLKKNIELPIPDEDAPDEAWYDIYIKIRELMGLPYMEPSKQMTHETYRTVCLASAPTHKPQKIMSYCNIGYQLAMDIINRVSGKRIDEFASEKLFDPLNMKDSHFILPKEKHSRFVTRGDEYIGSDWLNKGILDSESGSGGLKSTVNDLTRFGQMILNQGKLDGVRVLSSASIREIMSDYNAKLPPSEYDGDVAVTLVQNVPRRSRP